MSVTECKAVGVVDTGGHIVAISNLLRSLSATYAAVVQYEVVLALPKEAGTAGTRLKMRRLLTHAAHHPLKEPAPARWEVWHESEPLTGPRFSGLPAQLREVVSVGAYSNTAPEFWQGLGGQVEYEMVREGNEYHILVDGMEIKVSFVAIYSLHAPGNPAPPRFPLVPDGSGKPASYLLEAVCRVPEGRHIEGARALSHLAKQVSAYVELGKPEV